MVISSRKADVCKAVMEEINHDYAANGGEAIAIPAHVGAADDLRNLVDLLEHPATNANTRNHVVECLERLGPKAAPLADEIRELTKAGKFTDAEKARLRAAISESSTKLKVVA